MAVQHIPSTFAAIEGLMDYQYGSSFGFHSDGYNGKWNKVSSSEDGEKDGKEDEGENNKKWNGKANS